jgi:hypothetical protein
MDALQADRAEKFGILCSLIEGIWLKRDDEDYHDVDLDCLPPLTSPQARRIAYFIMDTLDAW